MLGDSFGAMLGDSVRGGLDPVATGSEPGLASSAAAKSGSEGAAIESSRSDLTTVRWNAWVLWRGGQEEKE